MLIDVSPTRMELLRLKKRLAIAVRGHKLLKDKLDEFIRIMLILIKEVDGLRREIDEKISEANRYIILAGNLTFPEALSSAMMVSEKKIHIEVSHKQILNIRVPLFLTESTGGYRSYGFAQASAGLDYALNIFDQAREKLIELSEKERSIQLVADEIQKTRRRVNALEYILIPNIEETIKYITMKLEEHERNNQTQLMRVKDIIRAPQAPTSAYPGVEKFHP